MTYNSRAIEELIKHIKYSLEIGADIILTESDAQEIIKALEQEPCEDCISRQAALECCRNEWEEEVKIRLKSLPPVTPQPKIGHWIPVNERLPYNHEYIKNNGLFNVTDGNRTYSEWFDIYDTQKFGEPTISGFRVDYAVTAWMPLPTPYESQESEDEE